MILNQCFEKYASEKNNTKAKEYLAMLRRLRDARFVLLLVGLAQIMELYCEVSLEGQEATHLPTQVWRSVVLNKQELELLSEH